MAINKNFHFEKRSKEEIELEQLSNEEVIAPFKEKPQRFVDDYSGQLNADYLSFGGNIL